LRAKRDAYLWLPTGSSEEQHELARGLVCEAGAAIFLYPRQREIDAGRNAGAGVDVSILNLEWFVFDAHAAIARLQLAAKFPMRGRPAPVQQSSLCEQKRADAHSAESPHFVRHLLQPCRECRITYRSSAQTTNQEHRVTHALDFVEMVTGEES